MLDGSAWRTALGVLSALGLGVVGVAVVPPALGPHEAALDSQVAAPADGADAASAAPAGPDATAPAVELAPSAPSFDTVRVEPDGTGLVAGRAEPGATVSILADEAVAAEVTADADGRFVAFFALEPSDHPRLLSLRDEVGVLSAETVIVAPNATEEDVAALASRRSPGAGATAQPDADAGPEGLAGGQGAATASAGEAAPSDERLASADLAAQPGAPEPPATALPQGAYPSPLGPALLGAENAPEIASAAPQPPASVEGQAPAQDPVLLSDAEGVRVVQPALAPDATPEVLATVALDAIAYDGSGEVVLSGRATDQGAVRLYLDNAPVADAAIGPDGTWTVPLGTTEPGVYTLRVDQLDAEGAVVSRIETPFQREERGSLEAALAEAGRLSNGIALRTVQPGNTLWAIARERYGEPNLYLRVFEANRDRIRNPDLIYPGQVFVLPDLD